MRISILTVFPEMVRGPLPESILKRAQEKGLLEIAVVNIRDFATDRHRSTDDYPYGGGPGMVMKPEPIYAALEAACAGEPAPAERVAGREIILTSAAGEPFSQAVAHELAQKTHLLFICGHYEGVDERIREQVVTRELSIGDYVLTGGELAALVMVDAIAEAIKMPKISRQEGNGPNPASMVKPKAINKAIHVSILAIREWTGLFSSDDSPFDAELFFNEERI